MDLPFERLSDKLLNGFKIIAKPFDIVDQCGDQDNYFYIIHTSNLNHLKYSHIQHINEDWPIDNVNDVQEVEFDNRWFFKVIMNQSSAIFYLPLNQTFIDYFNQSF